MIKPQSRKILLIINRNAGQKEGAHVIEVVVPFLEANGFQVEYSYTNHSGHATEIALEASKIGFDTIVAVGGDGTVNEVAQALIGTKIPMGIIPLGSGNGLAGELGISTSINQSLQTLINGKDLELDVWKFNQQRFLCTSGIGFDAAIANKMDKASSRGFWKYAKLVLQECASFQTTDVELKIDGQSIKEAVFMVTFANASQFGNRAFIAPGACMTDGLIDIVVVKKFSKIWLPLFAGALFLKLIPKLPFVDCYRANQIKLELADTKVYHFDGEPRELETPALISMESEKIVVRCGR